MYVLLSDESNRKVWQGMLRRYATDGVRGRFALLCRTVSRIAHSVLPGGACLLLAVLQPAALRASAALGVANDYNVFVAGNFTETGSDSGGRIAAGGNAYFTNSYYSVGWDLIDPFTAPSNDTLVVGGSIVQGPAQVYYATNANNSGAGGNAWEGSTGVSGVSFAGSGGSLTVGGAAPFSFASQFSFLTAYATQLSQLTANGTVTGTGAFTLTGTSPTLDIFDLPIADLGGSNSLDFSVPSSATILINVIGGDGSTLTTSTSGFFWNGTQELAPYAAPYENVLFNFYQATSINFAGSFEGTVLAPKATVTGTGSGQLDGGLIALSFNGDTEFHDYLFTGSHLPAYVPPVAEPTSFLLCGIALLVVGSLRRSLFQAKR